ncbi:hypothetical protein FQR65_LT20033 [Abscondita terminalis]|nr:hypothetical protein FQR65_LT20033 [Abscondita terminalis]
MTPTARAGGPAAASAPSHAGPAQWPSLRPATRPQQHPVRPGQEASTSVTGGAQRPGAADAVAANNGQALRISADKCFLSQAVRQLAVEVRPASRWAASNAEMLAQLGSTSAAAPARRPCLGWRVLATTGAGTLCQPWRGGQQLRLRELRLTREIRGVRWTPLAASGQRLPICRIALNRSAEQLRAGNLFGEAVPTSGRRDYVHRNSYSTVKTPRYQPVPVCARTLLVWAGPVSIATGWKCARRKMDAVVDAARCRPRSSRVQPVAAQRQLIRSKEAFLEALVPLVKDLPLLRASLQTRGPDQCYSTSVRSGPGSFGLTNQLTTDLRLRYSKSRDIRSANLIELYTTSTTLYNTVPTRSRHRRTQNPQQRRRQSELIPETSIPPTLGLIYELAFAPGLNRVAGTLRHRISATSRPPSVARTSSNRCHAGNSDLCGYSIVIADEQDHSTSQTPYMNMARFNQPVASTWMRCTTSDLSRINLRASCE